MNNKNTHRWVVFVTVAPVIYMIAILLGHFLKWKLAAYFALALLIIYLAFMVGIQLIAFAAHWPWQSDRNQDRDRS